MRKSINGLMTLVQHSFSLDPFADALFVFCNRNRDRLKILEWDGDEFWLYFKRLERGHFRWPSSDGESTMALNSEELSCLIDGARLEKELRRSDVFRSDTPLSPKPKMFFMGSSPYCMPATDKIYRTFSRNLQRLYARFRLFL